VAEPFARPSTPLCVVGLTYTAGLEAIDAAMGEHVAWLTRGYAEGLFVASGRKVPRTGGVILIRGHKREVEALVATDPFIAGGLAIADVIEFTASMAAPAVAELLA
jgi:uncharacterized protein YciI